MEYEHQINWTNVYAVKLDAASSRLAWNGSIYLLSTVQSLLSERMASSEVCTLYDRKNRTTETSRTIVAVCYALLLSVSFKSIFEHFALVINMLALLQFLYCHGGRYFLTRSNTMNFFIVFAKHYEFFKNVSKHYEFFHSV